ncbi:class I SAM-dependent methyltransferase [Candidatus Poribacteria bacterium]
MDIQPFTEHYYENLREGSRRSAREIIPLILELIQPQSVIDIGCGIGTWLSVFRQLGVEDVFGIDGDYVDREMLEIPVEWFSTFDLKRPLQLDRQFDLVLSLEVAQHIPKESAEIFVESLTKLGPIIVFSAAIPFQGGKKHVNEQWPDYWTEHFRKKGYIAIDCIRKRIWQNENVEWWYAQNMFVFVRCDDLRNYPLLKEKFEETDFCQLSVVHPEKYLDVVRWIQGTQLIKQDIMALIPSEDAFILADEDQFGGELAIGRCFIPFLERNGKYWGPPSDDSTAISELERLRQSGAKFIVFGWPAFWWLDHYAELHNYLRSKFYCILENDRLLIFDMRLRNKNPK